MAHRLLIYRAARSAFSGQSRAICGGGTFVTVNESEMEGAHMALLMTLVAHLGLSD